MFSDLDVVLNGIVEEFGLLRHKALLRPQSGCIDAADIFLAEADGAAGNVPEAEQEPQEGGLAAAGAARDAHDLLFGDGQAQIVQDLLGGVGEADLLCLGPGEGGVAAVGDVGGDGLFIQQVENTVGAGEDLRQAGTEVGQRHHRAEGAQRGQCADQHAALGHGTGPVQAHADAQHGQHREQDEGVGCPHRHALAVLHGFLLFPQRLTVGRDALGTDVGVLILQRVPQTAQTFQHVAVGVGEGLAVLPRGLVAALGRPDGHGHTHQQIPRQQHQRGQDVIAGRKAGHADDADHRNADLRNGVGVEDFQLLDIRRDEADEVAAVPAFELGGGQAAEGPEDLIPDEGQQLEGDEMVGRLFGVPQHTAQQRKDKDADKDGADRGHRAFQPRRRQ